MDTSTATGPESWRTGQDLLTELYFRTRRVKSQLNDLFSGQKKYFYKTSEAIIDAFDLPADKADMLRDFSQKLISCLDKARQQVQERTKETNPYT
jgi:preprotein translocase subunit SecA